MLPPISHRNLALHAAAADIMTRTQANGGATFSLGSDGRLIPGPEPTSGYAVGTGGGWVGKPDYAHLRDALYRLERDGKLPGTFGTWLWGGRLYLDPVTILEDRAAAVRLAREHGQLAVYNFATGQDIPVAQEPVYTEDPQND